MAAVGAHAVLYQCHHPVSAPASDAYSMSSYFSHRGSSTSSSASSFSAAALGATPTSPLADPVAAQFDISEFFFDDTPAQAAAFPTPNGQPAVLPDGAAAASATAHARSAAEAVPAPPVERPRTGRIAFRTRSEIEILDDGYKWRKYGKKSVKNSPNPRNYYRCSTEGCNVKKRVERDKDDPSYVVTTYEGTHNHVSPSTVYYASQDAASGRFFVAGAQPPAGSLN
ncbi:hypothetical protein GUJ93_ZPchr0010g7323 [Zizania palustris]|uniref:WRKY domain-containing protein n=1 Tax=Zizania palustris TaxID=103762 RepID=A0A8J5W9M2_ZIZPA|nr:hypothetical protein GUJ93_ZPchr0010g7323 [Zizania palustris]